MCLLLLLTVQYCIQCDNSYFRVFICMTDLYAQKSMHFLCLEPRETDKNVLKFTKNLVLQFYFLLLGPLRNPASSHFHSKTT